MKMLSTAVRFLLDNYRKGEQSTAMLSKPCAK